MNSTLQNSESTPRKSLFNEGISRNKGLYVLMLAVFVFGILLRLPNISYPRSVVFDEVFFGKFATSYCCSHDSIFDIHPPHAKILIATFAKLFGHQAGFKFEFLGEPFDEHVNIFGLRFAPAVAGALLPTLVLLLVVQLGGGLVVGFTGAMLLALDSSFWVQSRIVSLDPILLTATIGSLCLTIAALRRADMGYRALLLLLAGATAGMAVGSKITGMACLPLMGLILLQATYEDHQRGAKKVILRLARYCVWVGGGFAFVYLSGWWLHFHLLTNPGPGDAFFVPSGDFFSDLVKLHRIMFEKNAAIQTQHAYGSKWYTWPIMLRPVYYWNSGTGVIYLLGNPVVWYGTHLAFIGLFLSMVFSFVRRLIARPRWPEWPMRFWLPALSCIATYCPLMAVSRPLFLYHYFTTLMFLIIFVVLGLEDPIEKLKAKWPRAWLPQNIWFVVLVLAIIGFFVMLPMTSGAPFGDHFREQVYQVMPTWR